MVPRLWGTWFWTVPGTWGNATPESWSMKLAPTMAPAMASTRMTTSESTGTKMPCLRQDLLASRPAT
jgi:hypothetical protein